MFRDGAGRSVVETVFYDGPSFVKSHAWIGDHAGPFADPDGPSATELLWAFFEANPRSAGPAVQISFDPVTVDGLDVTISGTAADVGGVATHRPRMAIAVRAVTAPATETNRRRSSHSAGPISEPVAAINFTSPAAIARSRYSSK